MSRCVEPSSCHEGGGLVPVRVACAGPCFAASQRDRDEKPSAHCQRVLRMEQASVPAAMPAPALVEPTTPILPQEGIMLTPNLDGLMNMKEPMDPGGGPRAPPAPGTMLS